MPPFWHAIGYGTEAGAVLLEWAMWKKSTGRKGVSDPDIARWEVSEDGVHWRPYNPTRDTSPLLHKRIEFAPPRDDRRSRRE